MKLQCKDDKGRLLTACPVATLGLSWGVCFFLSILVIGGDAEDGPKVNERDNDDANTDPNPDPLRGCDCWSGDAVMETLWLRDFRSAAMPRGRDMNGGVVPVECGGVESRRQISLDDRADVWAVDMV